MSMIKKSCLALLICASTMSVSSAFAASRIYSPYVSKGELEVEYFGSRSVDNEQSKDNNQKHQFALGYGVNDFWKTEIYANYENEHDGSFTFDEWEWENIFQLTQRGEYFLDVGASFAYEYTPSDAKADTVEAGLLLAKDVGNTFHVVNLVAEKNVGAGHKDDLEGKVLWSSRYNYSSVFEPGFEIESKFGELNDTKSFDGQEHSVGPAAYGKIPVGLLNADGFKYRAAYLFGVSDAAPDGQAIAELEYEIHF